MSIEVIKPTTVHPVSGYSHAARHGNMVYAAGQVAQGLNGEVVGKGDISAQADQVYTNLKNVLEAAGSSLGQIVKMTTYTTSLAYRSAIREARAKFFGPLNYDPPNTFVVVASLATPDFLLEVEAIAVTD